MTDQPVLLPINVSGPAAEELSELPEVTAAGGGHIFITAPTPILSNIGFGSDAITARDDEATTDEDSSLTAINVLENDIDPQRDPLTVFFVDTTGTSGSVSINADSTLAYDPNGQFDYLAAGDTATDTFTYMVSDGNGTNATATVTITITGVNDAPAAVADTASTDEDSLLGVISVLTNDSDAESDTLTIDSFDTTGTVGLVTDNGDGTFAYDPNGQFEYLAAGESVTDSFTYTVSDGNGGTDTATVTITVNGVNDDPVATDDSTNTDEDTAIAAISVLGNDTDTDISDVVTVTGFDITGTIGTVTDNGDGTFAYDPNGQFEYLAVGESTTDSFTYTVSDGNGGTDTATVTITINGVNDDPLAADDSANTDEDTAIATIAVLGNDTDADTSDTLTVAGFDATGTLGTVINNGDGTFSYDPNGQFETLAAGTSATDSFTYTVGDGNGGTDTATVTITINGANDDPTAADDSASTDEDTALTSIAVLGNDSDIDAGDTLTITGFDTTGTLGIVTDNGDGTFAYDPNGQFEDLDTGESATDSFTYTVSDGNGGTDTATVTITIDGVDDVVDMNTAPVAMDDVASTDEDTAIATISVLGNDTDEDMDDLSITAFDTTATRGIVTDNGDGTFSYDPNGQYEGLDAGESSVDSFTYTVSDGNGGTDTATVTITINGRDEMTGMNTSPDASNDARSTDEDTAISRILVLPNDNDVDGDTLSLAGFDTTGTKGLVTDNGDGTFAYDPNGQFDALAEGETASDSFTYTVSDGNGGMDTATVTVTIRGVNDDPDALDDSDSTNEDSVIAIIDLLSNDSDVENDSLSIDSFDVTGTIGTVTDNGDGTFAYDPNGQFDYLAGGESTTDSFTYTVNDGNGGADTATVTITINGVNDDPDAVDDSDTTNEDSAIAIIDVLSNDNDVENDSLSIDSFDVTGTIGTVTDNGDGTFAYDPNGQFEDLMAGESTTDSFTYTVSDGNGGTDTATVTITINGRNDGPGGSSPKDDTLVGDAEDDEFFGLDGNDLIRGNGGNDTLNGGDGMDTLVGGSGADSLNGREQGDLIYGDQDEPSEDDMGPDGNDYVFGAAGDDTVFGQGGDDTLDGAYGDDELMGGDGDDSLLGDQGEDTIMGGDGEDTIKGGRNDDQLSGGDGDDFLVGNNGFDVLRGEGGNDELRGGFGNDSLLGGEGNDLLRGEDRSDFLSGGDGMDTLIGGQGRDTLSGEDDDDLLSGGGGIDQLFGDNGQDTLGGGGADDSLFGGAGNDLLDGNGGDDEVLGGTGDDTLLASAGNDLLDGEEGSDTFVFGITVVMVDGEVTSIQASFGDDTIRGFDGFQPDKLVFDVTFEGGTPEGDASAFLFSIIDDFVAFDGGDFDEDGNADDLNISFIDGGSITFLDKFNTPGLGFDDVTSLNKDSDSPLTFQGVLGTDEVLEFEFTEDAAILALSSSSVSSPASPTTLEEDAVHALLTPYADDTYDLYVPEDGYLVP